MSRYTKEDDEYINALIVAYIYDGCNCREISEELAIQDGVHVSAQSVRLRVRRMGADVRALAYKNAGVNVSNSLSKPEKRQRIAELVQQGYAMVQIARMMGIRRNNVAYHVSKMPDDLRAQAKRNSPKGRPRKGARKDLRVSIYG